VLFWRPFSPLEGKNPSEMTARSTSDTPRLRWLRSPTAPFLAGLLTVACAACARDGDSPPARPSGGGTAPIQAATPIVLIAPPPASAPPGSNAQGAGSRTRSAAPSSGGPPKGQNVLMVTVDSLRTDMPWNGYPRDIAPVMTAFEKTAVSYTRHYAISSYTSMSIGGLLAANYPSAVDRSGYFFGNYPDSVVMFPELLQKAGIRTLTAHAHFYFDKKAGWRQGFDVYEIIPGISADNTTDRNITSPQHLELAQKMLSDKANTDKPFFAWFHLLDPHDLYMQHPGVSTFGKKMRDLYDGEVAFTDQHIGKLLDFVGQQEWGKRTVVILSSDHGEAFGEHKLTRHGFEVWDVLTHVPLMIRGPGITPRRIDTPRSSIDLPATIMELFGVEKDPSMQGKSLIPELYGKEAEPRDIIIDLPRTSDNDRRRAFIRGDLKLTAYGDDDGFDLFDLKEDPGELKDIKRQRKEDFEAMKAAYKEASAKIPNVCPKMTEKLKGKKKGKRC
jgi:arylsulfatase A-like enzyme